MVGCGDCGVLAFGPMTVINSARLISSWALCLRRAKEAHGAASKGARGMRWKKAFCEASLQYLTHFPKARDAEPLSAERVSSCGQDPADPAGHALDRQKAAALINATASKLQACYMENEGRDGVALLLRPRVAIGATGVVHDVLWGAPRTDENYKNLLACCDLVVYALRFPMSQQGGVVQTPITLGY